MKYSSTSICIIGCLMVSLLSSSIFASDHADTQKFSKIFTFGVVPQQSASKLAKLWSPILQHVSAETGYKFVFRTAKNIPTFEARVKNGEYDMAYMNPYHYTAFSKLAGYDAILKQKNKRIKGIVVVRRDSAIKKIEDVAGMTLAFPAPAAFAASVLPRAFLFQQGIPVTPKYVSSHDSVYLNVAKGLLPAGGGVIRTLNNTAPEIKSQLRVLWTTKGYTPHAFAVHPGMNSKDRALIQSVFLKMNDSPATLAMFNALNFKGLEKAVDSDWNDVRALGISILNEAKELK